MRLVECLCIYSYSESTVKVDKMMKQHLHLALSFILNSLICSHYQHLYSTSVSPEVQVLSWWLLIAMEFHEFSLTWYHVQYPVLFSDLCH